MESDRQEPVSQVTAPESRETKRRSLPRWPLFLLLAASIFVPGKFWHDTWFGRRLSDSELREFLTDEEKPRNIHHALTELRSRIESDPENAREFYPLATALAGHDEPEIRYWVAILMGDDQSCEEFHEALNDLLQDPHVLVRYSAALSLSRFRDPSCRETLRAMLVPHEVASPAAGKLLDVLEDSNPTREGIELARIETSGGEIEIVRSPLEGKVEGVRVSQGDAVREGDLLLSLSPDPDRVLNALMALNMVGGEEELVAVQAFLSGKAEDYPKNVRQEAERTEGVIRARLEKSKVPTGS